MITGGLGPTADDITKPVLCEYFNTSLIVNKAALDNVRNIFLKVLQRPLIERNLKQAEVPASCIVIQNKRGTAPGMVFEKNGKIFIAMPGVPHEMKGMMAGEVIPFCSTGMELHYIEHRTILTAGIGESALADHIQEFETTLPKAIKLAYLPNYGMVRLRLTVSGKQAEGLESLLHTRFEQLKSRVSEWMVTDEDLTLQEVIGKLLVSGKQTLSTAESCTGGYVAHLITSIPGSSAYFRGSIIAYDNELKEKLLGVGPLTLSANGAVSEEVVREMITGAIQNLNTDFAIATSGIMGPGGGSENKPVGTVWIAAGDAEGNHYAETLVSV